MLPAKTIQMRTCLLTHSLAKPGQKTELKENSDEWVPVNTVWRVLRLRMEDRPPIWRVAANILNKRSRTVDKG